MYYIQVVSNFLSLSLISYLKTLSFFSLHIHVIVRILSGETRVISRSHFKRTTWFSPSQTALSKFEPTNSLRLSLLNCYRYFFYNVLVWNISGNKWALGIYIILFFFFFRIPRSCPYPNVLRTNLNDCLLILKETRNPM